MSEARREEGRETGRGGREVLREGRRVRTMEGEEGGVGGSRNESKSERVSEWSVLTLAGGLSGAEPLEGAGPRVR